MSEPVPVESGEASEAELQLLSELDREALLNERLRAKLIMGFCLIGGLIFLTLQFYFSHFVELFRHQRFFGTRVAVAMGLLFAYEALSLTMISRRIAQGRALSGLPWRYVSAVVELTLPSALVYSFVDTVHPVYGLLMPPTALYFLFVSLSALRLSLGICVLTGAVAAIEYLLLYWYGMHHYSGPPLFVLLVTPFHHIAKAAGFFVCGVAAGIVTIQLKQRVIRSLRMVAERNRVTMMFGLYVSPSVVAEVMQQRGGMDMQGEVRNVCVLFLDIRNFTQYSEKRAPEEVVRYLNHLFSFMIEVVSQHKGIINKFLGDGFMAIFGAPLSDDRACEHAMRAALQIVNQLESYVKGGELPPTRIGIGIHYGPAVTGSIGSLRRKEYTIIGDTVNLASRIEQLTKHYAAQVLVSASVLQAAPATGIAAEHIGETVVRGRQDPLELYKLA